MVAKKKRVSSLALAIPGLPGTYPGGDNARRTRNLKAKVQRRPYSQCEEVGEALQADRWRRPICRDPADRFKALALPLQARRQGKPVCAWRVRAEHPEGRDRRAGKRASTRRSLLAARGQGRARALSAAGQTGNSPCARTQAREHPAGKRSEHDVRGSSARMGRCS